MIVVQGSNFGARSAIKCSVKTGKYFVESHIHQFSEVVLVRDGSLTVTVDGKTEIAKRNDVVVISPFQVHSFDTESYCNIQLCLFSGDIIPEFTHPNDAYTCGERAVFTPSYELLVYIKNKIPDTSEELLYMNDSNVDVFRRVKATMYAINEEYRASIPSIKSTNKGNLLPKLLIWMRKNFTQDVTMKDAARDLGYTTGYISHSIEAVKNINFRGLLNSIRIEYARTLLEKTDKKIIDIAIESGFSCERSFHRAFLSIVGVTPGVYRKQNSDIA